MNAFLQFLRNPALISLLIGCIIGIVSNYDIPKKLASLISLYLIFTIGYKGGACLGVANACTPPLIALTLIGIAIGLIQPFINAIILKKTTNLDPQTNAVVASQYGSISIITFITAITFLAERATNYDTFMTAIAGIMELPALLSGLWLIKHQTKDTHTPFFKSLYSISKAIITCEKISIIFVGFFVGFLMRNHTDGSINSFIIAPFTLFLILFMIDVGIKIAKQRAHIQKFTLPLIAFGIYMPILGGILGIIIAHSFVYEIGSVVLFATLLSSASYIAVPAVMRSKATQAKEVIYLPLALGITLPFNIIAGIPLYYYLAQLLQRIS